MVFGFGGSSPSKTAAVTQPPGFGSPAQDRVALVTGSSGLCGARLVEMLLERGTATVIAFDRVAPDPVLQERFDAVQKRTGGTIVVCAGREHGDLTNPAAVEAAFQKAAPAQQIDIVYHVAALVGPFHDRSLYYKVNVEGTNLILDNCKKYKVPKLVNSSSPSTRFTGEDIENKTEDDLPIPDTFLELYAETKAIAERAVTEACVKGEGGLRTVSVAPHQIYGPHDRLFLQKILEVSGHNRLRIFGRGGNKISVCHVDNYCHGLMCGADALRDENSPALGQFYIVTDDGPQDFWQIINEAGVYMGFADLNGKFHLPVWLLYIAATLANVAGFVLRKKFKLNYFSLRMMIIHRYFDISRAKRDLKYEPLYTFREKWPETLEWFKQHWLPEFRAGQQAAKQKGD